MKTFGKNKHNERLIKATRTNIIRAAHALKKSHLVAFPTETVYGLGANATDETAIEKIFVAKGRPKFNPLIVHVFSQEYAQRFVDFCPIGRLLAAKFWPGPITLILPKKVPCSISSSVSAGLESIAIRIPQHPTALQLLKESNIPIAAPSANLSGAVSPTSAVHVLETWPHKHRISPKFILDGGECNIGVESTVVDLTNNSPTILRPGGVTREQIEKIVGKLPNTNQNIKVLKSPGMLDKHYAPRTKIILNASQPQPSGAFIALGDSHTNSKYNLSRSNSLDEAAANLFSLIREIDKKNYASISIAPIPNHGLGIAINDRLKRAAS